MTQTLNRRTTLFLLTACLLALALAGLIERSTTRREGFPTSILRFVKPHPSVALHPTQKPVALLEYLIKTYTNEGETVLDNCMGSGTTAIACINTNRNYIGFELDKQYCDIANERIQRAIQDKGVGE